MSSSTQLLHFFGLAPISCWTDVVPGLDPTSVVVLRLGVCGCYELAVPITVVRRARFVRGLARSSASFPVPPLNTPRSGYGIEVLATPLQRRLSAAVQNDEELVLWDPFCGSGACRLHIGSYWVSEGSGKECAGQNRKRRNLDLTLSMTLCCWVLEWATVVFSLSDPEISEAILVEALGIVLGQLSGNHRKYYPFKSFPCHSSEAFHNLDWFSNDASPARLC